MNASQCADYLEVAIGGRITGECAALLRRQHEAIKVLREALEEAKAGLEWYQSMVPAYTDGSDDEAMERINAALANTEQFINKGN